MLMKNLVKLFTLLGILTCFVIGCYFGLIIKFIVIGFLSFSALDYIELIEVTYLSIFLACSVFLFFFCKHCSVTKWFLISLFFGLDVGSFFSFFEPFPF